MGHCINYNILITEHEPCVIVHSAHPRHKADLERMQWAFQNHSKLRHSTLEKHTWTRK